MAAAAGATAVPKIMYNVFIGGVLLQIGEGVMAVLAIHLFGSFQAALAGEPLTAFESDKVQALLAYLAVEAERPFTREHLAELFWPERPEGAARSNLRHALAVLRRAIHDREADPPYLLITRQSIQFNAASDAWIDAVEFAAGEGADIDRLRHLIGLYNGRFLPNLTITDSLPFEEWLQGKQEQFERQLCRYLCRLTEHDEQQGDFAASLDYARRWVEQTPWQEEAHRQLIRLLALNGRRSEALAQYETCRRLLDKELAIAPDAETEQIVAHIRAGTLQREANQAQKRIRSYQLRQQIGTGGFGVVYCAYQPALNRDVAVKVILPQFANQPDFIRRFESEARLIAQLEHLHIVPLYDYWREPDSAYLVMRWLRGGSLSQSLQNGPWPLPQAAALLDQIAGALAVAHRRGIVHRDVKPANILLDEEGNAYLSDFGIAKDLLHPANLTAPDAIAGSLAYISPEQAQSQPVTPQSDLYSLGLVMAELLTGVHPFAGSTPAEQLVKRLTTPLPTLHEQRPDLPEPLQAVMQQATAREPNARFPGVLAFALAFREAVTPTTTAVFPAPTPALPEPTTPYKGLHPFTEADAADFFGRDALIKQLLAHLTAQVNAPPRFLAVVGPSGSGKSSVVKAGLLPALRRGAVPGSDRWFIVEMSPGAHPLDELEIGLLRIATRQPADLAEQLSRDERGLLRAARLIVLDEEPAELLLVIDQFEELYTLTTSQAERAHFLGLLQTAVSITNSHIRVIITLRADFYDRPLLHPEFSRLLQRHTELVLPLTAVELAQVIEEPAQRVGISFEPGLAATIAADVHEQSGALPMLQYALTELFERRNGRLFTHHAYKTSGGVSGALAQRAEAVYAVLDEAGQAAARQIFLRLVAVNEGRGGSGVQPDTRRRLRLTELAALQSRMGASAIANPHLSIVNLFGQHRLLTFDRDPTTREPTVEVAHEALLHAWERLRGWLAESRDDLRFQQQLAQAAINWKQAGQDASFLLYGSRLEQFASWSNTTDLALATDEQAYLEASLAAREARQAEETARLAHEQTLEQRSRRFLWALVLVFAAASVVAAGLSFFAFRQQRTALEAYSLSLAANAQQALADQDTATALALALAANQIDEPPPAAQRMLLNAAYAPGARRRYQVANLFSGLSGPVTTMAVQPNSSALLLGLADGTLVLWDPVTGEERGRLSGHTGQVNAVVVSADGKTAVSAAHDALVIVWNLETAQEIRRLAGHSGAVRTVDISPDGRQILSGGLGGGSVENPGELILWNAASGAEIRRLDGIPKAVMQAAFAQNGRLILAGSGDPEFTTDVGGDSPEGSLVSVHSWEAASGEALDTLNGLENEIFSLDISPDGERALIGSYFNNTAVYWDLAAGKEIATLQGHGDGVRAVALSADGTQALTGSDDRSLMLWDLSSGKSLYRFAVHDADILAVAFSQDGRSAYSSARDGSIVVWDLFDGAELQRFLGHGDQVFDIAFSTDGTKMLSASGAGEVTRGSYDTSVRLWDVATGEQITAVAIPGPVVFQVAFTPDGNHALAVGADPLVRVINLESGEIVALEEHGPWDPGSATEQGWSFMLPSLDVSQAHNLALTGATNGMMILWDTTTFQPILRFGREMAGDPWAVAISPDGRSALAAGDNDVMILWDLETGEAIRSFPLPDSLSDWRATGIAFLPDGRSALSASNNGAIIQWNIETGTEMRRLGRHEGIRTRVVVSEDGRFALTSGWNGDLAYWDLETGELIRRFGRPGITFDVALSGNGRYALVGSSDASVTLWRLPTQTLPELLAWISANRYTRELSCEEHARYGIEPLCRSADSRPN
ncbi:MAG: protein kinase [Candidatus Promineifilaceae bacterium]